jgi:pyruvate dehydrogenase E2 component (dihydrolipoamide acetyltransferase)
LTEFRLPELGENIDQGDLVRLMVAPGSSIAEGQPVMELETDKAVVEVPSSVTGTVKEVRVKEGQKIKVGQVIFTIENGAGAKARSTDTKPTAASPKPEPKPAKPAETKLAETKPEVSEPIAPSAAKPPQSFMDRRKTDNGPSEFTLPELGENIEQGELVRIMISPGAKVSEGQPVIELETDKAVVEVPSSVSGVVKQIKVKEGQTLKVGQVIFTLEGGAAEPVRAQHVPVEHASEQAEARLAFQTAMRAEGNT